MRPQKEIRKPETIKTSFALGIGALVFGILGCTQNSSSPPVAAAPLAVVTGGDSGVPAATEGSGYIAEEWDGSGQTVTLVPSSFTNFSSYVGIRPLNDPSNYKVNIKFNLVPGGLNLIGGEIKIGYTDVGQWHEGLLSTGTGVNVKCDNCRDNGQYEAAFNYFYYSGSKKVFSGIFQDRYGAVILSLEPESGSGDAEGTTYKGTLFYKNFGQSLEMPPPERKCWYIREGEYSCRSSVLMTKASYTDFDGFTRLGTFSGIVPSKLWK